VNGYEPNEGRHRGQDRDRIGTALGALWAAGHIAVLSLLGLSYQAQPHQEALSVPHSAPDGEPPV